MAGRSIYYGALLYLGHISSDFWLVVFTQAAVFLYLSHTLTIECLRLSFVTFVCATAITLIATPVSFFISVLMPDVFAGFLILSLVIIIGFWDSLKYRDRVILSCIIIILDANSHITSALADLDRCNCRNRSPCLLSGMPNRTGSFETVSRFCLL